jgi:hypothetical protein
MRNSDFTRSIGVQEGSAYCAVMRGGGCYAKRRHREPVAGTVGIIMIIVDPGKEVRKRISFPAYAPVICYLND